MRLAFGFSAPLVRHVSSFGDQDQKLRRSGMFRSQEETCRSYGAGNIVGGLCYKHDAPTALDQPSREP
jgi:hypothetical protein